MDWMGVKHSEGKEIPSISKHFLGVRELALLTPATLIGCEGPVTSLLHPESSFHPFLMLSVEK